MAQRPENKPEQHGNKKMWENQAELLKAMAHPVRLMVLEALSMGPQCVKDLNELVHVGVDLQQTDQTDDFTRFRTGLTARRATGRPIGRHQPDLLWYALHEWYVDAPASPVNGDSGSGSAYQFEFGVTLGATETIRIWRIPLPRVGLGYRFGGNLGVFRLVFGAPF